MLFVCRPSMCLSVLSFFLTLMCLWLVSSAPTQPVYVSALLPVTASLIADDGWLHVQGSCVGSLSTRWTPGPARWQWRSTVHRRYSWVAARSTRAMSSPTAPRRQATISSPSNMLAAHTYPAAPSKLTSKVRYYIAYQIHTSQPNLTKLSCCVTLVVWIGFK